MERRQEKKIGGQDIFYILTLFLGSTTIQWVRKLFLNPNEMFALVFMATFVGYLKPNPFLYK